MDEKQIVQTLQDKAKDIAKILHKGNDVELRKTKDGVKVVEVSKTVIN